MINDSPIRRSGSANLAMVRRAARFHVLLPGGGATSAAAPCSCRRSGWAGVAKLTRPAALYCSYFQADQTCAQQAEYTRWTWASG